jgi:dephospho-CoA kinase
LLREQVALHPNSHNDYLSVGITGGIGSGKSTVCRLFSSYGIHLFSADQIARSLMEESPALRRQLIEAFGDTTYLPDGSLNRQKLAKDLFTNPRNLRTVNSIVHPAVREELQRRLDELPASVRRPYVLIEAALVYESKLDKWLDYVIVVDADEEKRIQRVVSRDRVTNHDVILRMKAQTSPAQKVKAADFVIMNNDDEAALLPRVNLIHQILSSLSASRV